MSIAHIYERQEDKEKGMKINKAREHISGYDNIQYWEKPDSAMPNY